MAARGLPCQDPGAVKSRAPIRPGTASVSATADRGGSHGRPELHTGPPHQGRPTPRVARCHRPRSRCTTRSFSMSGIPSSTWYVDFFTELPNEFWRRAVPPEVTVEEIDFVEKRLGLAPRSRILDVPCGSGRHSLELARRGHSVTGFDL